MNGIVDSLSGFVRDVHFLRPWWLLTLPLLWGACAWLARRQRQRTDWSQVVDVELMPALRLSSEAGRRATPWPWLALAWTLAALALAGPSGARVRTAAFRAPAAWLFVLDLSPSMAAADLAPDRVTRARYAIADLLAAAKDARVGLVVFGAEPFTVSPLTDDAATVKALLSPLSPEIMPSAGDSLAPALERASRLLDSARGSERRVVVLSDGFDDPAAALRGAAALKAQGVSLSVVGIGSANGAPVPGNGGGFARDAAGRTRLARLDGDLLRQLAGVGGGRYLEPGELASFTASHASAGRNGPESARGRGRQVEVDHWLDGGVWLLPALLVLAAFLMRRGWL